MTRTHKEADMPWPDDVTLTGSHVTLEPLSQAHAADLTEAAADGDLHRLWYTMIPAPDGVAAEISRRRALRDQGSMLPFAMLDAAGRAVGMTTYMNIDPHLPRVEIGSTWLAKSAQRGPLNTQAKLLMLRHAFEDLDCVAVEFRTHVINHQSRRAIERLGARPDGILRNHMRMANGTLRDTAVYSILNSEWPMVAAHLAWQLERPRD
jgi:N-acetyltransferase